MVETFRPTTLEEALEIRAAHRAVPFAGGTDLMVRLRRGPGVLPGFEQPVLFLDRCAELANLSADDRALEIGSMVTLAALAANPLVPRPLAEVALSMAGPGIRSVATVGGNVCNASPAADLMPFLCAHNARARLISKTARRTLPVEELVTGPGTTVVEPDELLAALIVPAWSPAVSFWRKAGTRRANALTKVSLFACADTDGVTVHRARISLGAVAPTVLRLREVERLLEGTAVVDLAGIAARAAEACAAAVRPIDDQRSTADYRRRVACDLVGHFISAVLSGRRA
ncbi:MAG: FAD binding domain-containing protein [Spirochaetes bacterium]|nr:FAD binding domain-containing protein [Spirochaetota bacterium]